MSTRDEAIQADGEDHQTIETKGGTSPPLKSGHGHKRTFSGSILSRLSFLRTSLEGERPPAVAVEEDDGEDAPSPKPGESAMAAAQRSAKGRKRKGSLRKTALLGTGRLKAEGRDRRNSLLQRAPSIKQTISVKAPADDDSKSPTSPEDELPRRFSYEAPVAASSSDSGWSGPAQKLSLETAATSAPTTANEGLGPMLASPIKSPTSQSYTSTTDEDEALTFSRPVTGHASGSSSYFQSQKPLPRRRSLNQPRSPLSALPMDAYVQEEEWDYSETEWWGWVVLVVTWIVFVVGMGSCLEVWSWAWDVGQTPYAPPELEDDPTLPIVGYYPALIILTAVMAWVWVVVAWVGMKYFKHAKIQGDDT